VPSVSGLPFRGRIASDGDGLLPTAAGALGLGNARRLHGHRGYRRSPPFTGSSGFRDRASGALHPAVSWPFGRKLEMHPPEIKKVALAAGIPVFQPERLTEAMSGLRALRPDLIVVMAYGQFLRRAVLTLPPRSLTFMPRCFRGIGERRRSIQPSGRLRRNRDITVRATSPSRQWQHHSGQVHPITRRNRGTRLHDRLPNWL